MENNQIPTKKPDPISSVFSMLIWGFLMIIIACGVGGVAFITIKWFVSLIKGGL